MKKGLEEGFHEQWTWIEELPILVEQDELHEHRHLIEYVYWIKFDRYWERWFPNLVM